MFIDTHCHLSEEYYDNVDKVIEDSFAKGIKKIVISACSIDMWNEYLNVAKKYDNVYLTLGIHPEYVDETIEEKMIKLEKFISDNLQYIIGVGEIGLDYHWTKDNKNLQKLWFERQILIAKKYDLPIIVHTRDAWEDTIEILKSQNYKGIIHCFSGSIEIANILKKSGYYLGIGGVVTFKNSKLKDVVKKNGLDNVVFETDSPYLSPYRGNKNYPYNIIFIAEFLSDYLDINIEEISKITNDNVRRILKI